MQSTGLQFSLMRADILSSEPGEQRQMRMHLNKWNQNINHNLGMAPSPNNIHSPGDDKRGRGLKDLRSLGK